ncbi:MAG TPA: S9 family peptidase [Polyangiaceae bacterium]|nr:S9 family peptidase [Polyangiaceae bacterium]
MTHRPLRTGRPAARAAALAWLACAWSLGCEPEPAPKAPAPPPAPSPAPAPPPAARPAPPPPRQGEGLLPRRVLFGNPDRAQPKLSPDGKRLAFLAPHEGVMNVWVGPADNPGAAKPVTSEKVRAIRIYDWAYNNRDLVYLQDKGGDENWRLYGVDLASGNKVTDLTPVEGVAARLSGLSHRAPDEALVGLNDRDKRYHDLYRVNLRTGARKLVAKNEGFQGFEADESLAVRFALKPTPDGGVEVLEPDGAKGWKTFTTVGPDDSETTHVVGFDKAGRSAYLIDSRGRDTGGLFAVDLKTKQAQLVADDPKADVDSVLAHPTEARVQAVRSTYERAKWRVVDKALEPDFEALKKVAEGDLNVLSRSLDDRRWVVSYAVSDGPVRYYRYDRPAKKATFLFTNNQALEGAKLSPMRPVVVKARDGLDLVSYLTLPAGSDPDGDGRPQQPLPAVLLVHGGPWGRDAFGLNPAHQWLASRGYAVLSVNFRGSTGFGKRFVNAGDRQWGAKMHEDLADAVDWATRAGVADRARVGVMGGSYGGYATLAGLAFTPDLFACGVDIVGPSNLVTLLETIPPYWAPLVERFARRVGDHRTPEGRRFLTERSPLTHADRIKKPLLIGQGANDPRIKQAESDQIVRAMNEKGIPVTYVLYPDEGHGFARPENRQSFNAVAEAFFAQCLGGVYEPVGRDFEGSSIKVPSGAAHVHGLEAALGGGR